jgi:hypothetical protein
MSRRIYNWRIALSTAPGTVLQTIPSTGSKATFSSLTPGQIYCVEVNAVGAAGPTDFSVPARLMSL